MNGSDSVGADAVLKISSAQESVVVSMESAAIDTEDQTISQTIDNQAVIELPRDSRNVYSFLYLNPNITQADADGNFKFIGAQSYGASFSLDGQRSNGGIFGQRCQWREYLLSTSGWVSRKKIAGTTPSLFPLLITSRQT